MLGGKIKKWVFRENEIILKEAGPSDFTYLSMQDEISIYKNLHGKALLRLAILSKGYIFLEMALFDDSLCAASPKLDAESICLAVSK